MISVQSRETTLLQIAKTAANYTYLWLMGEMFNPHDFELLHAVLEAQKTGISRMEIQEAIALGERRGCQKIYWIPSPENERVMTWL